MFLLLPISTAALLNFLASVGQAQPAQDDGRSHDQAHCQLRTCPRGSLQFLC